MGPSRYVRLLDNRTERMVNPQEPARIWGGKAVTHTGYILPYGKGGYRHNFSGCSGGCGGMGAADTPLPPSEQGMPFMAWVLLLGLGGTLIYALLQAPKRRM